MQQAQQGQHATLAVKPLDASAADAAAADAAGSEAAAAEEPVAAPCSAPAPGQPPLAQPPPLRTDSAGCLRAWMQQTCSGPAEAGPARALPPSTPALAIQGRPIGDSHAALTTSHSAAQLGGSLRMLGSSGELRHAWGSSPQLGSAGSGAAPRPRKASCVLLRCAVLCCAAPRCAVMRLYTCAAGQLRDPHCHLHLRYALEPQPLSPALLPAGRGAAFALAAAPGRFAV